jgi:hypothetical protein
MLPFFFLNLIKMMVLDVSVDIMEIRDGHSMNWT